MALKVRKNHAPPPPEGCELNPCLSIIAGAWTPHVIWHLRAGPRRFGELKVDMPPVSSKVLTTRLRELEARGVIRRLERPTSPPSVEYELTDLGAMLVPALEAIVDVSRALDQHKATVRTYPNNASSSSGLSRGSPRERAPSPMTAGASSA